MPDEKKVGCARPTGGPVGEKPNPEQTKEETQTKENKKNGHGRKQGPRFHSTSLSQGAVYKYSIV